jgi:hypothetical protein
MIIMAGGDGYSYMLPAFPRDAAVVRIESLAYRYDQSKGAKAMQELAQRRIEAHKGNFLWFAAVPPSGVTNRHREIILKASGLAVAGKCELVTDMLLAGKKIQLDEKRIFLDLGPYPAPHKIPDPRTDWLEQRFPQQYEVCPLKRVAEAGSLIKPAVPRSKS